MNKYKEMLDRAKSGKILASEITNVAQELQNPSSQVDPYTLLHILGKAEAKSHAPLVERYLKYERDPMVARLALQILCDYWELGSRYISQIMAFMRGMPWDVDEEARQGAISIAGEYLRKNHDPDLLRELIRIFENESETQAVREAAYISLARAVGRNWNELPSAARHFDLLTQTQGSIIETAKRELAASALVIDS